MELPYTKEIAELGIRCRKCGQILETCDPLGMYIGENDSYFCDGNDAATQFHEMQKN